MLMQNFGVSNKEHYGMYGIFWSGQLQRPENFNILYMALIIALLKADRF